MGELILRRLHLTSSQFVIKHTGNRNKENLSKIKITWHSDKYFTIILCRSHFSVWANSVSELVKTVQRKMAVNGRILLFTMLFCRDCTSKKCVHDLFPFLHYFG